MTESLLTDVTPTHSSAAASSTHEVPVFFVALGRAGLAARGLVYITIGVLAAMAGLGLGRGEIVDQRQAIRALGDSYLGTTVLWGVAFGLAAYVLWRFGQALYGGREAGPGWKRLRKRLVALGSGLAYAGLSATAFKQALGRDTSGAKGDSAQQQGAEVLMSQPLGRWLVGILGAAIAGAALFQFWLAITAGFAKHLRGDEFSAAQERWTRRAGRAGYFARGVAFALIAWFFLQAALQHDASKAGGLAAALKALAAQPSGSTLLVIVGAGLAFFGVYSLIEARYRLID